MTAKFLSLFIITWSFISANSAIAAAPLGQDQLGPVQLVSAPATDPMIEVAKMFDQAQTSIQLSIYHISNLGVIQALSRAAKRKVSVRVIFDQKNLNQDRKEQLVRDVLVNAGVQVQESSPAFTITHTKCFVIDGTTAFVSTMNFVTTLPKMLEFGVITKSPSVIREMQTLFESDWKNGETGGMDTPALSDPNLIVSPVNAKSGLVDLINSSQKDISLAVENLSSNDIIQALKDRAKAGVKVHVLVPLCTWGENPNFNYAFMKDLIASGVDARMMPNPNSPEDPYVHAKVIVVDHAKNYVGSQNFSNNSLNNARELGVIFEDASIANQISTVYEQAWGQAAPPPPTTDYSCVLN